MRYFRKYWKTTYITIFLSILLSIVGRSRGQGSFITNTIDGLIYFMRDGIQQTDDEIKDQTNILRQYDFIIVGAGTAGCVLANRLSEIADWKILLIEAGNKENLLMDIPLLANFLQFSTANWKYKTTPSENSCLGFNNKQCNWPRGKVMGGSSVLNYMIYTRGNRRDYDEWKQMGNPGWGWDDVLPYFKKVENFRISEFNKPAYHDNKGYLDVDNSPFRTKVSEQWVKSAQELGYRKNDYNGKYQSGVNFLQLSLSNGSRHSSNKAYLYPIKSRNNLHVIKNSQVTKLLFDKKNNVIGVSVLKANTLYKIYAKKEVILSAGAINSPQLLLLSGIGPQSDLSKIGIPVRKNLMVGYNLMDHIAAGGLTFTVNQQNMSLTTEQVIRRPNLIFEWMRNRGGPLSVPGGCEALVFFDSKDPYGKDGWPDLELLFIGSSLNADPSLRMNFGFREDVYRQVFGKLGTQQSFMVFPMLMKPKSKGTIKLRNKNPLTHPIITSNYYTVQQDVDKMVIAIKEAINIAEQSSLKSMGARLYDVPIKDCQHLGFGSDKYWACQAKQFTFTIYHQSGTCKMGPESDPTAVVSPRLKIHGINGVRVIDASVIPEIPSAHTNAPTYMIAEKGADLIKEDWGRL